MANGMMSTRAIATVLGVSQSTAVRDARKTGTRGDVQVVAGEDGKTYRIYSAEYRRYQVGRIHYLSHNEGLSVRKIVSALANEGHHVSVGKVHHCLTQWTCEGCSPESHGSPEQYAAM